MIPQDLPPGKLTPRKSRPANEPLRRLPPPIERTSPRPGFNEGTSIPFSRTKPQEEEFVELEYVGFWPRVGAGVIDTVLIGAITWPLLTAFYGDEYWNSELLIQGPMDFLLTYLFPAVAVITFWTIKQATPGKMAISAKIVDAETGEPPTIGQNIGRYFATLISVLPLFLGVIWVAFDPKRQAWHDKLAGTVVVREKPTT